MTATLSEPATPARRPRWESMSEAEKDAHVQRRAAELDVEEGACLNRLRVICGLLKLAAEMAHAHHDRHGEACPCPGCEPLLMRPTRDLLVAGEQSEWDRRFDRVTGHKKLVAGIVTAAAYAAEYSASALESEVNLGLDLDADGWGDDLRKLADLSDETDAQEEQVDDTTDAYDAARLAEGPTL